MAALMKEATEFRPVCLDKILNKCHPVDVIVCSPVSSEFNDTAVESLRYLLTSPKRGVFLVNWIFGFQRRYRRIFMKSRYSNENKSRYDVLQLAEMSNKLCELALNFIAGRDLDSYTGLSTLIIDLGVTANLPLSQEDGSRDEFFQNLHVDFNKWSKVVYGIAEQAAPSLQHLLITDSVNVNFSILDDGLYQAAGRFSSKLCANLPIDEMLGKMPSLRTLYLPNLLRYEQTCDSAWKAVRDLPPAMRFAGLERLVLPTTTVKALHACKMLPDMPKFCGHLELCFDSETQSYKQQLADTAFHSNNMHAVNLDDYWGREEKEKRRHFDLYEYFTVNVAQDQLCFEFVESLNEKSQNERRMQGVWCDTTASKQKHFPLPHIWVGIGYISRWPERFDLEFFRNLCKALVRQTHDLEAYYEPTTMGMVFAILLQLFHEQPNRFQNLFRHITIRSNLYQGVCSMFDELQNKNPSVAVLAKKLDFKTFGYFPRLKLVVGDDHLAESPGGEWRKQDTEVEIVNMDIARHRVLSAFKKLIAEAIQTKTHVLEQQPDDENAFEYSLQSMFYTRLTSFEYLIRPDPELQDVDYATWTYADELQQIEEQLMYEACFYDDEKKTAASHLSYADAAQLFLSSTSERSEERPFPMLKRIKVRFDPEQQSML